MTTAYKRENLQITAKIQNQYGLGNYETQDWNQMSVEDQSKYFGQAMIQFNKENPSVQITVKDHFDMFIAHGAILAFNNE